jgi:tetratricopeptide (TPR) repeat protein
MDRMKRLGDRDTTEHSFMLRLAFQAGPFIMVGLCGVEIYLFGPRFVWFILPDIALTALVIWGANWFLEGAARAAGSILLPSGKGSPTPREYSEVQALVIRGRYAEAADSYRAIIEDDPADIEARLRLGALLEEKCGDSPGAEACYLGVRGIDPTPQQDWLASNALIDLYHREAQREPLKAELARLAQRHSRTGAGASAQRRLQELLDEERNTLPSTEGVP